MMDSLVIKNPKRTRSRSRPSDWYPFYAGFSYEFAHTLISSARLTAGAIVMDGWNGSGTTTSVATAIGLVSRGFDLNPVMVIVAKARLLNNSDRLGLPSLTKEIIQK